MRPGEEACRTPIGRISLLAGRLFRPSGHGVYSRRKVLMATVWPHRLVLDPGGRFLGLRKPARVRLDDGGDCQEAAAGGGARDRHLGDAEGGDPGVADPATSVPAFSGRRSPAIQFQTIEG